MDFGDSDLLEFAKEFSKCCNLEQHAALSAGFQDILSCNDCFFWVQPMHQVRTQQPFLRSLQRESYCLLESKEMLSPSIDESSEISF